MGGPGAGLEAKGWVRVRQAPAVILFINTSVTGSLPKIKPSRPMRPRLGTVSLRNTVQEPKTTSKEFQTWSPSL